MCACHRNKKRVTIDGNNIPWTWQLLFLWIFITFFIFTFLSCPYYSQNFTFLDINLSYGVVLGVAQVQEVGFVSIDVADALRMMKTHFFKTAIN